MGQAKKKNEKRKKDHLLSKPVCTENLIRVDEVTESPKLVQ